MEVEVEIHKVTEWDNGEVMRTQFIKKIWLPGRLRTTEEKDFLARANGGDFLLYTTSYRDRREVTDESKQ